MWIYLRTLKIWSIIFWEGYTDWKKKDEDFPRKSGRGSPIKTNLWNEKEKVFLNCDIVIDREREILEEEQEEREYVDLTVTLGLGPLCVLNILALYILSIIYIHLFYFIFLDSVGAWGGRMRLLYVCFSQIRWEERVIRAGFIISLVAFKSWWKKNYHIYNFRVPQFKIISNSFINNAFMFCFGRTSSVQK